MTYNFFIYCSPLALFCGNGIQSEFHLGNPGIVNEFRFLHSRIHLCGIQFPRRVIFFCGKLLTVQLSTRTLVYCFLRFNSVAWFPLFRKRVQNTTIINHKRGKLYFHCLTRGAVFKTRKLKFTSVFVFVKMSKNSQQDKSGIAFHFRS